MGALVRAIMECVLLCCVFFLGSAAVLAVELEDLATGQHSFRGLGSEYYVEVPVRQVSGNARLVLFNHRLAEVLGISPADAKVLENKVVDLFALEVVSSATNKTKTLKQKIVELLTREITFKRTVKAKNNVPYGTNMIATRYQDGPSKGIGGANGDGRVVIAGELTVKTPSGDMETFDISIKGVGQTPLAPTDHWDKLHKDGLQSIEEAVHSYIHSEANLWNGIDSTAELAVIELSASRPGKDGKATKTAISVRIGRQTRLAHLRYFEDSPEQFAKLFEYIVRRDLRLSANAKIGAQEVRSFLQQFTHNLAQDAARYYDLHAVHGSPTQGNRTTGGGTIDLGTFSYLDAHHSGYSYMSGRQQLGGQRGQTTQLWKYIGDLIGYLETAKYPLPKSASVLRTELSNTFGAVFEDTTARLALSRLGISAELIDRIPESTRQRFSSAVKKIYELSGEKLVTDGNKQIHPAAFDTRKLMSESFSVLQAPYEKQEELWKKAFSSDRLWAGAAGTEEVEYLKLNYIGSVKQVADSLHATPSDINKWSQSAKKIAEKSRIAPRGAFFHGSEKYDSSRTVLDAIANKESLEAVNEKANDAIDQLVDHELLPRNKTPSLSCVKKSILSLFK